MLSNMLDAPLVQSTVSRLIIDCNRDLDAPDLIWTLSEATHIAANENLDADERQYRIDHFHRPYHASIETLLEARRHAGQETMLICMHSFTPVYHGVARPWPIGLIHGVDTALHAGRCSTPSRQTNQASTSAGTSPMRRSTASR